MALWLECRIWENDVLVLDERIDYGPTEARRHAARIKEIDARGSVWVTEITDPDGELAPVRLSNDPSKLNLPLVATDTTLASVIGPARGR